MQREDAHRVTLFTLIQWSQKQLDPNWVFLSITEFIDVRTEEKGNHKFRVSCSSFLERTNVE